MKKLKILILLVLLSTFLHAQEYENDGVTIENGFTLEQIVIKARIDSLGGINEYFNQLLDVDKLQKAINIRRLVANDTLQDSIAVITDSTGINIYPRPYFDDTDMWPRLVNSIPYWFEQQETPMVKYNINFKELEDSVFRVQIDGKASGLEIDADNKAISQTEFQFGFQQSKTAAIDTVINKIGYLRGNLSNPLNKWLVEFLSAENQIYGTDKFIFPGTEQHYENYTLGGESKFLTYKSIENGHFDNILAISDTSDIDIQFKSSSGTFFTSTPLDDNSELVSVTSPTTRSLEDPMQVTAYYQQEDEEITIGKFNLLSYPKQTFNVVIIPVNDYELNTSAADIQLGLNNCYRQAVTEWNVTIGEGKSADFNLDGEPTFDANPEENENYTDDMGALITQISDDVQANTFYIFLIDDDISPNSTNLKGIMPYYQPYGFLFMSIITGQDDLIKTIAHELGHGAFRLPHFVGGENLMSGTDSQQNDQLLAIQWDIIQGNGATLNYVWEEGDESVIINNLTLLEEFQNNVNGIVSYTFLTPSGKPITIPSNACNIRFSTGEFWK